MPTSRSSYRTWVVALSFFSSWIALSCAFGSAEKVQGPFAVPLVLGLGTTAALAVVVAGTAAFAYTRTRRFGHVLLGVFVFNWVALAVNVKFYEDWKLENWLTVPFVVILYLTHRWFRFSDVSYGLVFVYMTLHIVGSHYTYAEVPFGFWMQSLLDLPRNHYDRIVHFSFGFLLAYPIREMVVRICDARGWWGLWFPIEFVLAFSCVYELLEWGIAVVFGGDLGIAYLGSQGDVWDAQKDMALAGLGSVVTMAIVLGIRLVYDRALFGRELGESLRVKRREVMGERALEALSGRRET